MKRAKSFISKLLALSLAGVMCFGMTACGENDTPAGDGNEDQGGQQQQEPAKPAVSISIAAPATTNLHYGESVTLSVTVSNTDNKGYFWSVVDEKGNPSTVLSVSTVDDKVTVPQNVQADTVVSVVATAAADTTKTASVTFTVKASLGGEGIEGLTSDMFTDIASANITVKGTLTDYHVNLDNSMDNYDQSYDMTVMMEDGKWYGAWASIDESGKISENVVSENYRMGEDLSTKYHLNGHALESVFINKDNEKDSKIETDYLSVPTTWESQHLWNQFTYFGTNVGPETYEYDVTNQVYLYKPDFGTGSEQDNTQDAWQLTYLAFYFTPLLDTTIVNMYLKVEEGRITQLVGTTAQEVLATDSQGKATAYEYSEAVLTFSDSGKTVVPEPTPYDEPDNVEALEQAIAGMKAAKNYTFEAKETSVSAPSASDDDYTMDSVAGSGAVQSLAATVAEGPKPETFHNYNTSNATVGTKGYVTENIVLLETTGEYSAYDTTPYYVRYNGYKQFDGYYETFESTSGALQGTHRVVGGTIANILPKFDFSPNLFEYAGSESKNLPGKTKFTMVHKFVLRDTKITRDIAMEISCSGYEKDAEPMPFSTLTIWVTEDGQFYQTMIPYSITAGTYTGFVTSTFSKIGSTMLDASKFEGINYNARVWKDTWDKYVVQDYEPNHDYKQDDAADPADVFASMFGSNWNEILPKPELFMNIVGDVLYGPWFDYKTKETDADGKATSWYDHIDITVGDNKLATYLDEKGVMKDVESFLGPNGSITNALKGMGYTHDLANSGAAFGNYYGCYTRKEGNTEVLIRIENNGTAYFFIEIYNSLSGWKLNRE